MASQATTAMPSYEEIDPELKSLIRQFETLIMATQHTVDTPVQGGAQNDPRIKNLIRAFEKIILDTRNLADTPLQGQEQNRFQLHDLIRQMNTMVLETPHMADRPSQVIGETRHPLDHPSKLIPLIATFTVLSVQPVFPDIDFGSGGLVFVGKELETYKKCLEARRKRQEAREGGEKRLESPNFFSPSSGLPLDPGKSEEEVIPDATLSGSGEFLFVDALSRASQFPVSNSSYLVRLQS